MSTVPDRGECNIPIRPMFGIDEEGQEGVEHEDDDDLFEKEEEPEMRDEEPEVQKEDPEIAEEARGVWSRVRPKGPTKEVRRKHNLTHFPFRSWCPACVAGRGRDHRHLRRAPEDREFPEISFDYAFPRKIKGGESITILVGR